MLPVSYRFLTAGFIIAGYRALGAEVVCLALHRGFQEMISVPWGGSVGKLAEPNRESRRDGARWSIKINLTVRTICAKSPRYWGGFRAAAQGYGVFHRLSRKAARAKAYEFRITSGNSLNVLMKSG